MKSQVHIAVFDTFKTKRDELTGEATRQRAIVTILAKQGNAAERTRTAISQNIAEKNKVIWKNIYSGIFRDLDEILIPLGFVEEDGRLPLKRGPKALQEKGIPYYKLTQKGLLLVLALNEVLNRDKIFAQFFLNANHNEQELYVILQKLIKLTPKFVYSLFERYVTAYCKGELIDIIPFSVENLRKIADESFTIQTEFLEGFSKLSKSDREKTVDFLKNIS